MFNKKYGGFDYEWYNILIVSTQASKHNILYNVKCGLLVMLIENAL